MAAAPRRAACGLLWLAALACDAALTVDKQTFKVNARIAAGCELTAGSQGRLGSLDFGTASGVSSGQVTAAFIPEQMLSLACTPGVTLRMQINGGQHRDGGRNMQRDGGSERVPYRLYTSSAMGAGNEIGIDTDVSIVVKNGNNIALPLYGAAQLTGLSPAGTYSDQLTVTLSW